MSPSSPTRMLVLATSALDRRALSAALSEIADLEVLAVVASPASARERLLHDDLDLFLVDAEPLEPETTAQLESLARGRGVRVLAFTSGASADATAAEVIAQVSSEAARRSAHPRSPRGRGAARELRPVVAVGSSTGGPDALADLLPRLPRDFPATVLLVQHMPANFTNLLARRLAQRSQLEIREAEDGDELRPGCVLVAPGDHHLVVDPDRTHVRLNQDPPENSCRPAVDVLFRSVAGVFGAHAVGIVLTGMGRDGWSGARALRAAGAEIWVQDEATSVVWGMPGLIARDGLADRTANIPTLARSLVERYPAPRSFPTADLVRNP